MARATKTSEKQPAKAPSKSPAKRPVRAPAKGAKPRKPAESPVVVQEPISDAALELSQLWDEFKRSGAPSARERLILHYAPLVKYVASWTRSRR